MIFFRSYFLNKLNICCDYKLLLHSNNEKYDSFENVCRLHYKIVQVKPVKSTHVRKNLASLTNKNCIFFCFSLSLNRKSNSQLLRNKKSDSIYLINVTIRTTII